MFNERIISSYTAVKLLDKMRAELGLEAMLEYMRTFTGEVEKASPALCHAVQMALARVKMEDIYKGGQV